MVTIGAIGPSGPSAFCEAPAGLSLSSRDLREIPFPFPSSSKSSIGANRADDDAQHRQESNGNVNHQDLDTSNDDRETDGPVGEKSNTIVEGSTERETRR